MKTIIILLLFIATNCFAQSGTLTTGKLKKTEYKRDTIKCFLLVSDTTCKEDKNYMLIPNVLQLKGYRIVETEKGEGGHLPIFVGFLTLRKHPLSKKFLVWSWRDIK